MRRKSIPNKYSFKFFYVGIATLVLTVLLVTTVIYQDRFRSISVVDGAIADLALVFMVLYAILEVINFTDVRRFVDYRYSFDAVGLYREKARIMEWKDVSSISVTLETMIDSIPPKRDIAWAPSFNIMRDFSTPELTTKRRIARITVSQANRIGHPDIVVYTTTFRPRLWKLMKDLKNWATMGNGSLNFDYQRVIPEPEERDRAGTKDR